MQSHHSTDVGLAADLETINGASAASCWSAGMPSARPTVPADAGGLRSLAGCSRAAAHRAAVQGRSTHCPLSLGGRCPTCREERRAGLNVWLQFTGRFRAVDTPPPWQGWLDDHLRFLADHKGHVAGRWRRTGWWSAAISPGSSDGGQATGRELASGHHRLHPSAGCRWLAAYHTQEPLSTFRQFLRFLVIRGVGSRRWSRRASVSTHGQSPARPTVLTEEQRRRLLRSFPRCTPVGRRNYAMTICMIDLGLRISEVVALRLDSVDEKEHLLTVPALKPVVAGRYRYATGRGGAGLLHSKGRPKSDCANCFFPTDAPRHRALSRRRSSACDPAFRQCGFP